MADFGNMADGYIGRVKTVYVGVEPTHRNLLPVQSAPHEAGPAVRKFAAKQIDRMPQKKFFEQPPTEKESTTIYTKKQDGYFPCCVNFLELSVVIICDSYQFPRMDKFIDTLSDDHICSTIYLNSGC